MDKSEAELIIKGDKIAVIAEVQSFNSGVLYAEVAGRYFSVRPEEIHCIVEQNIQPGDAVYHLEDFRSGKFVAAHGDTAWIATIAGPAFWERSLVRREIPPAKAAPAPEVQPEEEPSAFPCPPGPEPEDKRTTAELEAYPELTDLDDPPPSPAEKKEALPFLNDFHDPPRLRADKADPSHEIPF